jgi:hypothetical protein
MILLDPAEPIDISFKKYCHSLASSKVVTDRLMNNESTLKQHLKLINEQFEPEIYEPSNFTVHDFNEAIYSTLAQYVEVNFAQVENCTFYFLMQDLIQRYQNKYSFYVNIKFEFASSRAVDFLCQEQLLPVQEGTEFI